MNLKDKKVKIAVISLFVILALVILLGVAPFINYNIANSIGYEKYQNMEGVWTCENYVGPSGMEYLKKVDVINADKTIDDTLYLKDGNIFLWKGNFVYNGGDSFTAQYEGISFLINFNNNYARIDNKDIGIEDLRLDRIGDGKDIVGVWKNSEPFEYPCAYKFIGIDASEDGSGIITYSNGVSGDEITAPLGWTKIGEYSYGITISKSTHFTYVSDNEVIDSLGNVFKRTG